MEDRFVFREVGPFGLIQNALERIGEEHGRMARCRAIPLKGQAVLGFPLDSIAVLR